MIFETRYPVMIIVILIVLGIICGIYGKGRDTWNKEHHLCRHDHNTVMACSVAVAVVLVGYILILIGQGKLYGGSRMPAYYTNMGTNRVGMYSLQPAISARNKFEGPPKGF